MRAALEMLAFSLIDEVTFFYSHWALHSRLLYASVHKKHHEWKSSVALAASYSHPLEYLLTEGVPIAVSAVALRPHLTTLWIYRIIYNVYTLNNHSGYHLPWMPSSESHDYHHLKFNVNFGSLGYLDKLHRTDLTFKRSKNFLRHRVLKTMQSARELFPDD